MRRGILLALGTVLIAFAVFALSAVITAQQRDSDELAAQSAGFLRTAALYDGVSGGLAEIVRTTAGLTITTTNQTVAFTEQLPNPNSAAFSSAVAAWESFIQSNDSAIRLSTGALTSTLGITLSPSAINYSHNSFGGNQLRVLATAVPGGRYDVNISIAANVTACVESVVSGTFELVVVVDGSASSDCTKSLSINPAGNNRLAITTDTGPIDIDLNASRLFITSNATTATVTTQLWYNATGQSRREARLAGSTITVGLDRLGIVRTATPLLTSW